MKTKRQDNQSAAHEAPEDPLRTGVRYLGQDQEQALRRELIKIILTRPLTKMYIGDLQQLARFADIQEHDCGCATPAEDFITKLVDYHYGSAGLTPDDAAAEIECDEDGFRSNFDNCFGRYKTIYRIQVPA